MTIRSVYILAFFVATLFFLDCAVPETPRLCLVRAEDQLPDPCELTSKNFSIATGDAFIILHELPDGVTAPEPLDIRIETPCVTQHLKVDHKSRRLAVSRIAPKGTECFFSVSTSIQQSKLSYSVSSEGNACKNLGAECGSDAGLGAEAAE